MNHGQMLWHKVRLAIKVISIFLRVKREGNFLSTGIKSVSSMALAATPSASNNNVNGAAKKDDNVDGISHASSEDSALHMMAPSKDATSADEPDTFPSAESEADNRKEVVQDAKENTGKEWHKNGNDVDGGEDEGLHFRKRLRSIVKPANDCISIEDEDKQAGTAATGKGTRGHS